MSPQKYKIYINGTPVLLLSTALAAKMDLPADKSRFVSYYTGKKKLLKQYIDLLDKNHSIESVAIIAADLESLWSDFQSMYKLIEAAGGYVLNDKKQLLVFYRRGSWDMPKGKIDPGETPEMAAVREVQEETGLQQLHLEKFLTDTWHTYEQKDKRILKKTWWYRMHATEDRLTPQTEEDILEARWVDPAAWIASETSVYGSIRDVILEGLKD